MSSNIRLALAAVVVAVILIAGGFYWYASQQGKDVIPAATTAASQAESTTPAAPAASSSDLMVPGPLGEQALGDPKAPNTVIEYASMTCSHCQRWHADVYPAFKAKYVDTGKVYFIFREYPLDPLAKAAIVEARCAPADRYFPLVDLMFDHQDEWAFVQEPVTALQNLLKQAGIGEAAFMDCLKNQTVLDGVNWVHDRAEKQFGVNSTPTFFVNGKMMEPGEHPLAEFDTALGG